MFSRAGKTAIRYGDPAFTVKAKPAPAKTPIDYIRGYREIPRSSRLISRIPSISLPSRGVLQTWGASVYVQDVSQQTPLLARLCILSIVEIDYPRTEISRDSIFLDCFSKVGVFAISLKL